MGILQNEIDNERLAFGKLPMQLACSSFIQVCIFRIVNCLLMIAGVLLFQKANAQVYPTTNYNTSNGLINNRTGSVAQDAAGYMWFGTDNGICSYDGRSFKFFPAPTVQFYFAHGFINPYGDSVLFSTGGHGIAVCYKDKVRFISFPGYELIGLNSALPIGKDSFLVACLMNEGIRVLSGKHASVINSPVEIFGGLGMPLIIRRDKANNIWIANERGLLVFPKGNLRDPWLVPHVKGQYIHAIQQDKRGNVYVIARNIIYKYSADDLISIRNANSTIFYQDKKDFFSTVAFDEAGNAYIGSQLGTGLVVYDKDMRLVARMNTESGLASSLVWDLFIDRENNTWVTTENGISKFNSIFFRNYPPLKNDYSIFKSAVALNDSTLLGNNGTTFFSVTNGERREVPVSGFDIPPVGYIEERLFRTQDGRIWIMSYTDVTGKRCRTYAADFVNGVLQIKNPVGDQPGNPDNIEMEQVINGEKGRDYMLDVNRQLWVYEKGKFKACRAATNFEPLTGFDAIGCNSSGQLWLFNNRSGLMHVKLQQNGSSYWVDTVQFLTIKHQPLVRNKLAVDERGRAWLALAPDGIFVFAKNKNGRHSLKEMIGSNRLGNNSIREIAMDDEGFMYAGTNFGIYRIDARNEKVGTIEPDVFGNHLTGKYIYHLKYHNDKLYIGTTGSLAIVSLRDDNRNTVKPKVFITGLSVNNIQADSLIGRQGVRFSSSDNSLSFTFTSPSFINEKNILYTYYLEGADKGWSTPSPNYTVSYNDLKPGHYQLKVLARNANGIWSSEPSLFSFLILKPFYMQTWFIALCALVVIGIIYLLYRLRLSKLLAVERTRQKISKDLHDDVGSALSSITLMNAVLKKKIQSQPEEAIHLAGKVEDTSREMIQNMSDIVWSINPGNDGVEKLQARLQQFAGTVFEPKGIDYRLYFPKDISEKELTMEMRRDLYMIFKEIMNNAAKYSEASYFELRVTREKRSLEMTATDNGKGFDIERIKKGNGLNNIIQRVALYKGNYELKSTEKGTAWYIKLPVG